LSLVLVLAAGCGHRRNAFCGLASTVNGFDYVAAAGIGCGRALALVPAIERGDRGAWACSRSVGGAVELRCLEGGEQIELLEGSPVPARRNDGTVTLANRTFRLGIGALAGRGPWCVPDVPREVLVAFRLRPITPHGGCFTRR
jgi:hypothetical protein